MSDVIEQTPRCSQFPTCTDRELARMVQAAYHVSVDHRGVRRVLEWHHLSPEVWKHRRPKAQQVSLPPH